MSCHLIKRFIFDQITISHVLLIAQWKSRIAQMKNQNVFVPTFPLSHLTIFQPDNGRTRAQRFLNSISITYSAVLTFLYTVTIFLWSKITIYMLPRLSIAAVLQYLPLFQLTLAIRFHGSCTNCNIENWSLVSILLHIPIIKCVSITNSVALAHCGTNQASLGWRKLLFPRLFRRWWFSGRRLRPFCRKWCMECRRSRQSPPERDEQTDPTESASLGFWSRSAEIRRGIYMRSLEGAGWKRKEMGQRASCPAAQQETYDEVSNKE